MPPIETRRLRLCEMTPADLDQIASLLGDDTVMEFYPSPKTRAEAAAWIDWNLRNYAASGFGLWLVETLAGEFLGDCGLTWQIVDGTPHLEVGYHVTPSAQGQGFATEAALACREYARSQRLSEHLSLRHTSPVHLVYTKNL